jgi:hypothetical protein
MPINYGSNDVSTSGLITAISGNFTQSLQVNGTGVSISGHTHTSSDITNFNSSVSGLLPANLVTGSGVTNHIPYWSSTSGLLADSNQLIWDSTNNRLGIGISNPQNAIHISGSSLQPIGIRFDNGDGYGGSINADNGILNFIGSDGNTVFRMQSSKIRMGNGSLSSAIELTSNGTISQDGNGGGLSFSGTIARLSNGLHVTGGSIGIGTTSPSGQLHVIGTGLFSNRVGIGISGFPTWISQAATPHTFVHISGVSGLFPDVNERGFGSLLRLNSGASTNNPRIDFRIGGPGNYDSEFFISRNGTDVIGIGTNNKMFLPNGFNILNPTNNGEGSAGSIVSYNDAASWITLDNNTRSMIIAYRGKGVGDQYINTEASGRLKIYNYYSEVATFDNRGRFGLGTTTPNAQIHVIGSGIFSSGISTNGDVSSTGSFIAGSGSAALPSFEFINDVDTGLFSPATNTFGISTSGVERLRIDSVGRIGIGTASPSSALQVSGLITANSGNFTNSLQLNGSGIGLYDTSVFNLGTISGTNAINCGQDRQIQTLTLNGVATTFTTGTGWPSSNSVSRETTLNIFASGNTSVTWTIVNDWYRQPDSPLPSGRHIVLLRSVGSGNMQGHYIGNKTN